MTVAPVSWICLLVLSVMFALVALPAGSAPDEEQLGRSRGYPMGTGRSWFFDERVRVGSFSHLDQLLPYYTLRKSDTPLPLVAADSVPAIGYRFQGHTRTVEDFLAHQRITGLLIIKDGQILVERYQYDRNAAHRFVSHSMAKSIVSLAVGLALEEKKIRSLDDWAANYVHGLAGSAYGETSIRNLLRMSSGVRFSEVYDGKDDLAKFTALRSSQGSIKALRAFSDREVQQGTRFHYATSETVALAALLRSATGNNLSEYLTERLWQPMGAEADATWIKAGDGLEIGGGSFNAVLRDYGRLGILLANDGAVGTRQVVPKHYLLEATSWRHHPEAFAPMRATSYFGYGYQFWTYPGEKRRFALLGVYGQSIFVDPQLKLVMVITAAARNPSVSKDSLAAERDAVWRGLISNFGSW